MTKSAENLAVITFNHVERSSLIHQELNCNVCQLVNMFSLIRVESGIFGQTA